MTFNSVLEKFLLYHRLQGHTEKTILGYSQILCYFNSVVHISDFSVFSYSDIEKFHIFLLSRNLSNATISTYLRHIKAFVHWLCDNCYIQDKTLYKSIIVPKTGKKNPKIYNEMETKAIFDSVQTNEEWITCRDKLVIALMLDSGLRQEEVTKIRFIDFDFSSYMLVVHGKGNKDRYVPIGDFTLKLLKDYLFLCPYSGDFLLFSRNGEPLTKNSIKKFMNKLKLKLGFDFSSHLLRHNFATNYLIDQYNRFGNFNAYSLMVLLGHNELATTDKYVHLATQYIAATSKNSHLDSLFINLKE